jgi:hypothetical protein
MVPSRAGLGSLTFRYPPLPWRAFTFAPVGLERWEWVPKFLLDTEIRLRYHHYTDRPVGSQHSLKELPQWPPQFSTNTMPIPPP